MRPKPSVRDRIPLVCTALKRAALALVLLIAALPARAAIPWLQNDVDEAFRQAKVRKQPLLVYFHTTWCSWCATMEDKVFSDEDVTYQANAFVALRLNCDRRAGQKLVHKYGVTSFPTVLAMTPEGEVLGRIAMFRPVPDFLRFLREVLTPEDTLAALDKRIEGGERVPDLLLRSAERHFEAGENDLAVKRYEQAIASSKEGSSPESVIKARLGLARLEFMKGDSSAALDHYMSVLREFPRSPQVPEAFTGALVILREESRGQEIDALFQEFGDRFPDDPALLNDHARRLLESGGGTEVALQKATRAVALAQDSADYQATLSRALRASQRPMDALQAVHKAIELRPTDKDLRILRLEILEDIRELRPSPAASKP